MSSFTAERCHISNVTCTHLTEAQFSDVTASQVLLLFFYPSKHVERTFAEICWLLAVQKLILTRLLHWSEIRGPENGENTDLLNVRRPRKLQREQEEVGATGYFS